MPVKFRFNNAFSVYDARKYRSCLKNRMRSVRVRFFQLHRGLSEFPTKPFDARIAASAGVGKEVLHGHAVDPFQGFVVRMDAGDKICKDS